MAEGSNTAERIAAQDACDQVRTLVEAVLDEQKQGAAAAVHGLADALRHAAHALTADDQPLIAGYVDRAATGIDRFSATLRRPWGEILASAESWAEGQPGLFLVGAMAAGFAFGCLLTKSRDLAQSNEAAADLAAGLEPGP